MEEEKQKELFICEMCGYEWLYELDSNIENRKKEYESIRQNKRCVSCCREFGIG